MAGQIYFGEPPVGRVSIHLASTTRSRQMDMQQIDKDIADIDAKIREAQS
jgi:hypothetical protein